MPFFCGFIRHFSCPPSFWRIGGFARHQYGGQFSVNSLVHQGSGLPKKAPPPTGMVELLCDRIETTMGHCDLFQWLKKDSYPLEVNAHYSPSPEATESCTLSLSVRDQIGSCFKPTPLVLSVQWELNSSKTISKTQCKRYGQA